MNVRYRWLVETVTVCVPVTGYCSRPGVSQVPMSSDLTQPQHQQRPLANDNENNNDDNDAPLDFSVRRHRVTSPQPTATSSLTSSLTSSAVTSLPVPVLFRPALVDPSGLVSALLVNPAVTLTSLAAGPAAGNLVSDGRHLANTGDVASQVRAYVQSKIVQEQRRLLGLETAADSSVHERCTASSPARSSPTSTTSTTPSVGLEPSPPCWLPTTEETSGSVAGAVSRKRVSEESEGGRDTHYWERRRKNNEAAKRSRDARRAKEEEVALRASVLEQENRQLRVELTAFRLEVARLSELLCRQVAALPPVNKTQDNNSPR